MNDFGGGMLVGVSISILLNIILIFPLIETNGYAFAIEDVKFYGAEKVVARFDRDRGKLNVQHR